MGKFKTFEPVLEGMGFNSISFQMHDCHAWYFDVKQGEVPVEVKIQKEDSEVYYRCEGEEDWIYCDTID